MIALLDLKDQYDRIKPEIDAAIERILTQTSFIGGKEVTDFETAFAKYVGAKHCIGVGNGTDAIEIAIEALNLPPKSEIIVPANSFIASSEAVTRAGHKVVFCDCDPDTYTVSIPSARARITSKTKAIIAVHLYGHPCDMDALMDFAKRYELAVIEDCAQAHGAEYKGQKVGTFGDFGTFSFYPGKNLGAYGDAGAITTQDEKKATRVRMIANHGRIDKYNHQFEGRNSRLDSLQAAILSVKLNHIETWTKIRRHCGRLYQEGLKNIPELSLPTHKDWANPVYHLFVIRTPKRDALQAYLNQEGIQTGIHYPIALPKLEAYSYLNQSQEPFFAHKTDTQLLSIPMGDHLSDEQVQHVISKIKAFFN